MLISWAPTQQVGPGVISSVYVASLHIHFYLHNALLRRQERQSTEVNSNGYPIHLQLHIQNKLTETVIKISSNTPKTTDSNVKLGINKGIISRKCTK